MPQRETKTCVDCQTEKPLGEFTSYRTTQGYRRWRSVCKPCASERGKRWYAKVLARRALKTESPVA